MKLIVFFSLIFSPFLSFSQTIIHDENTVIRGVEPFSSIKVSGDIDVYLSQSNEYALAVSASDEKYRDAIKTEVNDSVLSISYNGSAFKLNDNRKLRVYTAFKKMSSLEASGGCNFIINGIYKANSCKVELTGAGEIRGTVHLENLVLNISGASAVKLKGVVTNMKISAGGASDVKSYDLSVDNCIADLSGASDVKLTVHKSLAVRASGASNFYYKGSPEKTDITKSGASAILQKPHR